MHAGTWIDTGGRSPSATRVGRRMRLCMVTQCASAHSCASASSTAITPAIPSMSSAPTTTLVTVMYCCEKS